MSIKPLQIEKKLTDLHELKEKLSDSKAILNHYKIKSDRLTDLNKAKKELNEQVNEEHDRIEADFLVDKDYETAKHDESLLKTDIKEKNAELRELMAQVDTDKVLTSYNYNIKGEEIKMQVERTVVVYINGKEEK